MDFKESKPGRTNATSMLNGVLILRASVTIYAMHVFILFCMLISSFCEIFCFISLDTCPLSRNPLLQCMNLHDSFISLATVNTVEKNEM